MNKCSTKQTPTNYDLRIFKSSTTENGLDNMEYYLKDIGEYNYMTDTWVYYVSANERLAKLSNSTPNIYYAYDHLGNTRIAFSPEQRPGDSTFTHHIHFAADYYPYGKILRSFESSSSQEKYLTTQHERDRETGFDYRGARYYDSDVARFLSLDPLASQYPAWSDYNYVMGNPISLIDPDGKAPQHIDVTKNKDETYTVVGGEANSDKNIYVVGADGKRTGEVVGQMLTEYSFHREDGSAVTGTNINLNDKSGQNFFNNEIKNVGLFEYMNNAKGGEPLDFKTRDMPKGLTNEAKDQYVYRGMSFEGKVASARDIGNYSAGYVSGVHGFGWGSSRFAFDALQTKQEKGTWNTVLWYPFNRVREGQPTQQAQRAGHNVGYPIFKQRQFEREWQRATNPYPIGPKY
jgi:RHS repeat-associated protein